jgi:hypothetical protein
LASLNTKSFKFFLQFPIAIGSFVCLENSNVVERKKMLNWLGWLTAVLLQSLPQEPTIRLNAERSCLGDLRHTDDTIQ